MKSKPDHHEKKRNCPDLWNKEFILDKLRIPDYIIADYPPPGGMNIYEKDNELCERSEKNLTDRK